MWCEKLGIEEFDEEIVNELIGLFHRAETDMTLFFRQLAKLVEPDVDEIQDCFYELSSVPVSEWEDWLARYLSVAQPDRLLKMNRVNPKYVLRNWMAQLAIDKAEVGDFSLVSELHELLKHPYDEQPEMEADWYLKRPEWARHRVGCSMLSCSS